MKYKLLTLYYYILYKITPTSNVKALYYATYIFFSNIYYSYMFKRITIKFGMCFCIKEGLKKVYPDIHIFYKEIGLIIKNFNNIEATAKFNAEKDTDYWWNVTNIKDRYNYFKYLIKHERNNN